MLFAPLEGWRHVKVTDRRTAIDYAQVLKNLADTHVADGGKIMLVQDNLNTHAKALPGLPAKSNSRHPPNSPPTLSPTLGLRIVPDAGERNRTTADTG